MRHRRAPMEPSADNKKRADRYFWWVSKALRVILRPRLQLTVDGAHHVPREEPVLVVCNHVHALDPINLILAADRCIHWLATESLWDKPVPAWFCTGSGAVPRKKFVTDSKSIRHLKAWRDLGGAVGLFPEGERTWDGTRLPLVPGIEKLVRLLDAPVVTARVINAYRHQPRWADHGRRGRIHVEFDPPRRFDRKDKPEEVRRYIEERITVDPAQGADWEVKGSRLAHGLANVLFACPNCHTFDGLVEKGDDIVCRSCGAGWRLDTNHRLHPSGGGGALTVADAVATARSRLAQSWVADAAAFAADGTILHSEEMELLALGDEIRSLGTGRMRLSPEALVFSAGAQAVWTLPLSEMRAVAVDMQRRLQFRDKDGKPFEAVLPQESVLKWYWVADHWRKRAGAKDVAE